MAARAIPVRRKKSVRTRKSQGFSPAHAARDQERIFILGLVHGARDLVALWRREKRTGETQP
jgi:hypothetical protein